MAKAETLRITERPSDTLIEIDESAIRANALIFLVEEYFEKEWVKVPRSTMVFTKARLGCGDPSPPEFGALAPH